MPISTYRDSTYVIHTLLTYQSDANGLSDGLSEESEENNEDKRDWYQNVLFTYLPHTYLTHPLTDENGSRVREDESESVECEKTPERRGRRRLRSPSFTPFPGRCREHQQSAVRQSLSRSPKNCENEEDEAQEATKSDISLGDEPKR